MKKEWLILFTLLSGFLSTSCSVDDAFDGYHGSGDMTQNLPVNWEEAANKSAQVLTFNLFPQGSKYFGKEIYWDISKENPTEQFRAFDNDIKVTSQLEAVKLLINQCKRSNDEATASIAKTVLSEVSKKINTDNHEELVQLLDTKLALYDYAKDASVWADAKALFQKLEESTPESKVDTKGYTKGKRGISLSSTDDTKTSKANGLGVITAVHMYNIANALNEKENADKYLRFATNVFSFCTGRLYSDAGKVLTSVKIDDAGTVVNSNDAYIYANQGYLMGAMTALYNVTKDETTLDFAILLAKYQIKGNYTHRDFPMFLPNYSTDSNTFLGNMDRNILLSRSIFLHYLSKLVIVSEVKELLTCIDNNVESMWVHGQEEGNCLWGTRWYEAPYAGEYSSSSSVDDPYNPLKVISLEAQVAGTMLLEIKASLL